MVAIAGFELYWGYIRVILGLYSGYIGVILGLYWGYTGVWSTDLKYASVFSPHKVGASVGLVLKVN